MTIWQWTHRHGWPYLTCDLLDDWPHGFFTRDFWPQPPEQLTPLLDNDAIPCRIKQVHGNRVVDPPPIGPTTSHENAELPRPEADGLLSNAPGQALWVCSADCNPVLIGNRTTGQVAAVHAGWRGTALKIVPLAVEKLLAQGAQIDQLVIAIGPAIAGDVYQVSTHVAAEVGRTIHSLDQGRDEDLVAAILAMENSPLQPDPEPGRMRLDVRRVNCLQLERIGLASDQIAVAPHCTFQDPERFFSYRRTREKKVQWSGIVSRCRN